MSVHMPPTHNQKMPCQHQQDTHKQETAHTPPKVRLKRGYTAGLHQDITDTPPRRHQITTDIPPISRPAEPRHNTPTTHNTTKPETDRKRSAQTTWRRHHQNTMMTPTAQHEPHILQCQPKKTPRWAKMNPKQPNMNLTHFFCKSKFPSSNFHFHTLFIHSKFPLMPLTMLCMSACAAPWNRIN